MDESENHEEGFRCCPAPGHPAEWRCGQFLQRVDGRVFFGQQKMRQHVAHVSVAQHGGAQDERHHRHDHGCRSPLHVLPTAT